jgi:hypothetical protein
MNIPKVLWASDAGTFIFTDGCKAFLTSDFMFNVYLCL